MSGFLNVFVPTSESLGGGFAEYAAARERAAKQRQALEGYKQGLAGMAQGNPALAPFERAVQGGANAQDVFGMVAPEYMKLATTQATAQAKRTSLIGIVDAEMQGGNKDPALPFIKRIAMDPNANPEVIDKFYERLIPREVTPETQELQGLRADLLKKQIAAPPKEDDEFLKWARDNGIAIPSDPSGKQALYNRFLQQTKVQIPTERAAGTSAAGFTGRAEATEKFEAPKVMMAANDWEKASQGLFAATGSWTTPLNVASLYANYYKGDPAAKNFFDTRGALIEYAQDMRGSMRLSNTEFTGLMQAINSPFQSMASIHQIAENMRRWARRPEGFAGGGVAAGGSTASAGGGRKIGTIADGRSVYEMPDGSRVVK